MDDRGVINVASVPHRSPFRYPGGKTWLVPQIRRWLTCLAAKPRVFCEPFCGGAIVGLSVLFEDLAERLLLVELDDDVAAVWKAMLNGDADRLIDRIRGFKVSKASVDEVLRTGAQSPLDHAFATIVRNRVQRGGILAPGASLMKAGEAGRGVASRWYAETLQRRIAAIHEQKRRIEFIHGDGIACMRGLAWRNDTVSFIDPPYTVAGRRLYTHSEIDHAELFGVAATLQGDFLMTYDDAPAIRELAARFGFDTHTVPMKNTHHEIKRELLIGRNLDWARTLPGHFGQYSLFELRKSNGASSH